MYSIFDEFGDIAEYKKRTERLACFFEKSALLSRRAVNMHTCGTAVGFAPTETEKYKIAAANFCRERLCPNCQRRKSLKIYGEIMQLVEKLQGYSVLHLVLSRPNVTAQGLNKELSWLFRASSEYFRMPLQKNAFKGILRACEVTYNLERDDFHPHLHCLVFVNKSYFTSRDYISHDKLSHLWDLKTGVPNSSCYISRVKDIQRGVAEVAKYAVKPLEMASADLGVWEAMQAALGGRRLLQTYGVVKTALKDLKIDLEGDIIGEKTEVEYWGRWNETTGSYDIERAGQGVSCFG